MKRMYTLTIDGNLIAETESDNEFGAMDSMRAALDNYMKSSSSSTYPEEVQLEVDSEVIERFNIEYDFDKCEWVLR